jgi:hypothetical protein
MTEEDRQAGLQAILNLVRDANTCLGDALDEVLLRGIPRSGVLMGAIGAARTTTKYAVRLIQATMKAKP